MMACGYFAADQGGDGAQVLDHQVVAGPDAALRRAAEAALVVGVGGDPLLGPPGRGQVEGVGVVVHAVDADDHRPGLAGSASQCVQAQPRAVEADEAVVLQARPGEARRRRPAAAAPSAACRRPSSRAAARTRGRRHGSVPRTKPGGDFKVSSRPRGEGLGRFALGHAFEDRPLLGDDAGVGGPGEDGFDVGRPPWDASPHRWRSRRGRGWRTGWRRRCRPG